MLFRSDFSDQFNGTRQSFTLSAGGLALNPVSAAAILIALGGVVQAANKAYTVSANQINFTEPPAIGTEFYGVAF